MTLTVYYSRLDIEKNVSDLEDITVLMVQR